MGFGAKKGDLGSFRGQEMAGLDFGGKKGGLGAFGGEMGDLRGEIEASWGLLMDLAPGSGVWGEKGGFWVI